jgi:hypothetical protein
MHLFYLILTTAPLFGVIVQKHKIKFTKTSKQGGKGYYRW